MTAPMFSLAFRHALQVSVFKKNHRTRFKYVPVIDVDLKAGMVKVRKSPLTNKSQFDETLTYKNSGRCRNEVIK